MAAVHPTDADRKPLAETVYLFTIFTGATWDSGILIPTITTGNDFGWHSVGIRAPLHEKYDHLRAKCHTINPGAIFVREQRHLQNVTSLLDITTNKYTGASSKGIAWANGTVYYGAPLEASPCKDIHRNDVSSHVKLPSHLGVLDCQGCCHRDLCADCGFPVITAPTTPNTVKTATTTPTPSFVLQKGLRCQVCTGPQCGVFPGSDQLTQCPDHFPYCMSIVENDERGDKFLTKKCASETECDERWVKESSSNPNCLSYDPADIYNSTFSCTYCCETEECNKDFVPHKDTLFIGP